MTNGPDRWRDLIRARDPVPDRFCGTEGLASVHRLLGQPVEDELRRVRGLPWWFDPELPLDRLAAMDTWITSGRGDESPLEFRRLCIDYGREMERGTVFPPLLVFAVDPEADRAALGELYCDYAKEASWAQAPCYRMVNGRHRALGARHTGRTVFPAFAVGPGADFWPVVQDQGRFCMEQVRRVAGQRGRHGVFAEVAGQPLKRLR